MFSGIIESVGTVVQMAIAQGCKQFTISTALNLDDVMIGESISINGACLTVTSFTTHTFDVLAVPETLRLTNLNKIDLGSSVNLERAMKASSRIGGHYVQGHIDCMGQILKIEQDGSQARLVKISLPQELSKYVVTKGYISLDGMSITVVDTGPEYFTVTFIPHTQSVTITKHYDEGHWINIEVDIMGKYIEKLLGVHTHANTHRTSQRSAA